MGFHFRFVFLKQNVIGYNITNWQPELNFGKMECTTKESFEAARILEIMNMSV